MTDNYLSILAETIRTNWDAPALTDFYLTEDGTAQDTSRGNHYTYGEMYAELCHVAELLTSLGLQKGDHIAICGANSAHWVIAYLAIAKMQGVSVTVMHSLMPDEIARLVDFSDAKALFVDEEIWDDLTDYSLPQLRNVISLGDWQVLRGENISIFNLQSSISKQDCAFPLSAPDSLAMICFTSGTSGNAKGVILSHRNLSATIHCVINNYKIFNNRNMLVFLPMAHLLSTMGEILSTLSQGAMLYVCSPNQALDTYLKVLKITTPFEIVLPPIVLEKILTSNYNQIFLEINKTLDYCVVGGSVVKKELAEKSIINNIPFTVGYGLTETSALIGIISAKQYKIGTCGKVCETLAARISPEDEILVKGENVMLGYYKDPEATARKIDSDGWLHTGDKGHLDEDGYLYVEGRLEQDMIVLPNGENIHPEDIERKINALPEVKESIVLARDGKLVAIAVPQITNQQSQITNTDLRRIILRKVNPSLPLYSQLYDVEITDVPLQKTEKQTIKRYLYK